MPKCTCGWRCYGCRTVTAASPHTFGCPGVVCFWHRTALKYMKLPQSDLPLSLAVDFHPPSISPGCAPRIHKPAWRELSWSGREVKQGVRPPFWLPAVFPPHPRAQPFPWAPGSTPGIASTPTFHKGDIYFLIVCSVGHQGGTTCTTSNTKPCKTLPFGGGGGGHGVHWSRTVVDWGSRQQGRPRPHSSEGRGWGIAWGSKSGLQTYGFPQIPTAQQSGAGRGGAWQSAMLAWGEHVPPPPPGAQDGETRKDTGSHLLFSCSLHKAGSLIASPQSGKDFWVPPHWRASVQSSAKGGGAPGFVGVQLLENRSKPPFAFASLG